jgi:sterol desaturase/sphingolipid hydroxylase (fatty acid hydroxylase superfamily)
VTPTPWAIFAFQPGEAIIQFIGFALIVIFLPLHPLALLAFLTIDTFINTAGHCGYEFAPKWYLHGRLFSLFSTVTSHDVHHTNMRVNFGSFFNVWDRICGTFDSGLKEKETAAVANPCSIVHSQSGERLESGRG